MIIEMLTTLPPYAKDYPSEMKFMGALGANRLSYRAKALVPDASVPMQIFLAHLFVFDPQKRLRYGTNAREKFMEEFPL